MWKSCHLCKWKEERISCGNASRWISNTVLPQLFSSFFNLKKPTKQTLIFAEVSFLLRFWYFFFNKQNKKKWKALTSLQGHRDLSRIINRFSLCQALCIHCTTSLKPDLILLSKKWSFCCCFSPSVISHGCQGNQCVSFQHRLLGLRKEVLQCWPAIFIEPLHNTIY